jgi:hypothetical protein
VDSVLYLAGYVAVDIIRLDMWLQRRNPDYQEDDSMRGFVGRKYGKQAELFVEYWLKGEAIVKTKQEAA